jgi:hypothetical protein
VLIEAFSRTSAIEPNDDEGMGELYIPKFVNYLERKDLISLTMKSRMDQTEFTQFIDS